MRLVPPFDELEVDKYFQHFEKVAESLKWPIEYWSLMLQSVIKGKAQQAYSALSVDDASKYEVVKQAILSAYELVPEAYRQKFRSLRKIDSQTYVEFAHDKEVYFERWCTSRAVNSDFKKLKDLLLVEEFKRCVKDDIKSCLDEKDPSTLHEATKLADDYSLTHKSKFGSHDRPYLPKKSGGKLNSAQTTEVNPEVKDRSADVKKKFSDTKKEVSTGPTCHYCKKPGHVLSECLILQRKREKGTSPNALVKSVTEMPIEFGSHESFCHYDAKKAESSDLLREEFLPFVSEGFVSPSENSPSQPIRILRDTGASQSLLLKEALPSCESEDIVIGDFIVVQGIEGRIVTVPLHSVFLKSDLVTGQVKVGLMFSLPVKGISLLLGNDLAGGKVVPSVQLTFKPSIEDESKLDLEFFPSCAVTRAMANQAREEENSVQSSTLLKHDLDRSGHRLDSGSSKSSCFDELSDTFLGAVFDQHVSSLPQEFGNDLQVSDGLSLSRKQLITEQSSDPEIAELREKALPNDEIVKVPVGFYLEDGVLMRKWRPPDIPANEDLAVINQVVVPKVYRKDILTMAHSLPLGGHLGVNKTVNKIMKQFFWPGLRKDVAVKDVVTCSVAHATLVRWWVNTS